MIFATVGAQMPFDRMIRVVDEWAARRGRRDVLAQVGAVAWKPPHIQWVEFMDPLDFRSRVEQADVVVAHAGMGSIITALELGKPILVMPRRSQFHETRNDHQVATAQQLLEQNRVSVAFEPEELSAKLDQLEGMSAAERVQPQASAELLGALREFVWRGAPRSQARCKYDGIISIDWHGQSPNSQNFERRLLRQLPAGFPVLRVVLTRDATGAREFGDASTQSLQPELGGSFPLLGRLLALTGVLRPRPGKGDTLRVSCLGTLRDAHENSRIADEIAHRATVAGIQSPLVYVRDAETASLASLLSCATVVDNWKDVLRMLGGQSIERALKPFSIRGVDAVPFDGRPHDWRRLCNRASKNDDSPAIHI